MDLILHEEKPDKLQIKNWQYVSRELLSGIPSSSYKSKTDSWEFSKTWQTALALQNSFPKNLTVSPEVREWMQSFYEGTILPAYNLRDKLSQDEGFEFLFPHQKVDAEFLATSKRVLLANDQGTGKSQGSFAGVRLLHERGEQVFPVLIACPNSTKYGWVKEIESVWSNNPPEDTPELNIIVIDGTAPQKKKLFKKAMDSIDNAVIIMNWESLRSHSRLKPFGSQTLKKCTECAKMETSVKPASCEVHIKELNEIDFGTVIGDEIHRIKEPSSKVARALKGATGDAEFRFGLSGTPIASNPADLFSALNWLMPEAYPSKSAFLDRFCDFAYNEWGAKEVFGIRESMKQEFFYGLDPFFRRVSKEAVLDFLPPLLRERRDVYMNPKQKKAYNQMRDNMIAELDDGDVVYTTSALTKMTRLLQFASAYAEIQMERVYDEELQEAVDKPKVRLSDPSCKISAFMEDMEDFGDNSVVVFAASKQLINMLSEKLTKEGVAHGLITGDQDAVERKGYMEDFQSGKIKYILCTLSAGGTGITLTKGSIMVFLQRSWSMIDNLQAEARAYRIGSEQHESVLIVDYVTKDTAEEAVIKAVENKTDQLQEVLRDKELMAKVLRNEEIENGELIDTSNLSE